MKTIIRILIVLILTVVFTVTSAIIAINLTGESHATGTGAIGEALNDILKFVIPFFIGYGILFWFTMFKYL